MTSLLLLKSMLFANALEKSKKKKKTKIKKPHKSNKNLLFSMCRICDEEKGIIPIFNNFVTPNIPEEIQHFSGITLNKSDNLSKHMCQNCLNLLNGCIMFREMCQKTNKKFLELSIKKEYDVDSQNYEDRHDSNHEDNNEEHQEDNHEGNHEDNHHQGKHDVNGHSDDSYNIPSPAFSEELHDYSIWGCSACSKEFRDMRSYNSHLRKCNPQTTEISKQPEEVIKKKFLCDTCGKTATSNASLLVHMVTHENVFPFKCDVCPYKGRTIDLLRVHKRSHLADKPFKCSQCPKSTSTASNLNKHMRHVHSTTRPYKCTYCDKAFSYQHDMKRHVRDIHLRQGTVECDICCKKFNTKKILQGHRLKVHKIKGERGGRLPAYLKCQMDEPNSSSSSLQLC